MRVLELLTHHVVVARRDEPLLDAIRRMREEHVGAVVVVVPTARAIERLNRDGERTHAILHVTC